MKQSNVVYGEVFEDVAGEFRWRAMAGNDEIVATSESYTRKEDAERALLATFPHLNTV